MQALYSGFLRLSDQVALAAASPGGEPAQLQPAQLLISKILLFAPRAMGKRACNASAGS